MTSGIGLKHEHTTTTTTHEATIPSATSSVRLCALRGSVLQLVFLEALPRFVLDQPERPVALVESGTGEVVDRVRQTPGAIGYADLGAADQAQGSVGTVSIDGFPPTLGLVRSGAYGFWAIERMYTRDPTSGLAASFIDHVASGIQTGDTFIRIQDVPDGVLASHE